MLYAVSVNRKSGDLYAKELGQVAQKSAELFLSSIHSELKQSQISSISHAVKCKDGIVISCENKIHAQYVMDTLNSIDKINCCNITLIEIA